MPASSCRQIYLSVLCGSLVALIALSVGADDSDEHGSMGCVLKQILDSKGAAEGDMSAQTELGLMYLTGHCVTEDKAKAKELLEKPAEQGNTEAIGLLGEISYRDNQYSEAARWARLAAEKGGGGGQSLLAWLYHLGQGVPKDDSQALKWAQLAADQGMGSGARLLGTLYQNGSAGLSKNYIEADKWYLIASKSKSNNKSLQFSKKVLEDVMSKEDKEKALERADAWHPSKEPQY